MEYSLIVNPGSSSKKYALYKKNELLITTQFEKTADGFAECVRIDKEQQCNDVTEVEYSNALQAALDTILRHQIIADKNEITKVGVRIVAPGEDFAIHQEIDGSTIDKLQALVDRAPLHIPPILDEIVAVASLLPKALHVGVSDSAFHSTIPEYLKKYSLLGAEELGIKRFGYHGSSVGSVARRLEKVFGAEAKKVAVMHVGNGVSVTGLLNGKSVWTSMGYTPASGEMMGSRSGGIDPGALIAILHEKNLSGAEAQKYIQTQGGFVGLLGVRDLRAVMDREANKDEAAHEAMELFITQLAQNVAQAATVAGGLDAVAMTGTAVERNDSLRKRILARLAWLGVEIDELANENVFSLTQVITKVGSKVAAAVIPTDEMGEMVRVCNSFN